MAAVFPVYYVVRPNPNLLAFLAEHPRATLLHDAFVVSREEPFPVDHDYPGQTADCETFAKLCCLAKIERDRIRWSNEGSMLRAEAEALAELLGSARMTVATFDRWWSLERVGRGFEDLDRLIEDAPLDLLKKIEGPHERSPLAEEAAREARSRNAGASEGRLDEVTGLPRSALGLELPEWPASVGTWWDEIITKRAQESTKRAQESAE